MAKATKLKKAEGDHDDRSEKNQIEGDEQLLKFGAMGKAFSILETLTGTSQPLSMAELARETGMTKPTAHRIISILAELGFVERDQRQRGYVEGARLIQFALDTLKATVPRNMRHTVLRALTEETGETCNFGILVGAEVIYLDRVEAKWPLGLRFDSGTQIPAHCSAIGKLLLSFEPAGRRDELIRAMPLMKYTKCTITTVSVLLEDLEEIQKSQIGTDNEESIKGMVCVAVPVHAADGGVVGAIAISAPEARVTMSDALKLVPKLRQAATRLGKTFSLGPSQS